jgi:FAD/FMN-containing dehydrogenase/Fe-S oxidoreductase
MEMSSQLERPVSERGARALHKLPVLRESSQLERVLRGRLRGEVRFDSGSRALYSTAASNYRHVPVGVVVPRDVEDMVAAVEVCRSFHAPIVHRGGGTSLAGQTSNVAVVIDSSKYVNALLELDPDRRFAWVEPGLVLDELRTEAERSRLTFGPDPSTHNRCTLGGMIGNNSCGVHSVMAGCTEGNVQALEILTYDGTRMIVGDLDHGEHAAGAARAGGRAAALHDATRALRDRYASAIRAGYPGIPRRVSGYNLPALLPEHGASLARSLVGSEGTLVTVLRAKVSLVASPPHRVLVVLGYPSVYDAADHVPDVLAHDPIGLEGVDDVLLAAIERNDLAREAAQLLPPGKGWLLAELGGESDREACERAEALTASLARAKNPPEHRVFTDRAAAHRIWTLRESGLGATARGTDQGATWEGWEDASVPPDRLGAYLREFRGLLERYDFVAALYGHFGQGCVHTRIPFDLRSERGVAAYRAFVEEASDLVVEHGGSLSGEHGDGQSRAELLPRMFAPELISAFEELKAIWDPDDMMNPGKLVRPRRLDQDLRLGAGYRAPDQDTHFRYPEDRGSFAYASERCVGVGECRRLDSGVMCPSFMVTREEAHSTRGRAHLLFETMRGGLPDGWRSDAVRDALDLCLACKGCKSDCPVGVDVATYKAEYLAHYYRHRLRPRSAYVFGLVYWWARLGSLAPRLVNAVMRAPVLGALLKLVAGVAAERVFPELAREPFRRWWRSRAARPRGGKPLLLWADTFNAHWQPDVLIAAVELLEDAGYEVMLPERSICCGRPLYDYGMLHTAKALLREALSTLRPYIRAGVPVVALEPSCLSVFRDELVNLFPDDPDAQALKRQSFMLDELLDGHGDGWQAPRLERRAIVQAHCHQHALMRRGAQTAVLLRLGVEAEQLDAGCCGMAGGFGFERDHYDVSVACGERRLLPAVREAAEDTLVIADGFSCREQIHQRTGRRALHLAQVIQMARLQGPSGPTRTPPEAGSSLRREEPE